MKNNVVSRTTGEEFYAEFLDNVIQVYKLEKDGTRTPRASIDNIHIFANHYALIEYKNSPLLSARVKDVIKTWMRLHENEPILHISFYDYNDYADVVIKTRTFCYSVEVAQGTIDFNKIDSDVNYTLESLGL